MIGFTRPTSHLQPSFHNPFLLHFSLPHQILYKCTRLDSSLPDREKYTFLYFQMRDNWLYTDAKQRRSPYLKVSLHIFFAENKKKT